MPRGASLIIATHLTRLRKGPLVGNYIQLLLLSTAGRGTREKLFYTVNMLGALFPARVAKLAKYTNTLIIVDCLRFSVGRIARILFIQVY